MDDNRAALTTGSNRGQAAFACNLLALTSAQREQHVRVVEQLKAAVLARKDLMRGYAFQFAPQAETLQLLAEFVQHERLCCPFFAFTIRVEPENGPIWLELTGQAGIKPFIRAELNW